jgi:hypothetical protein
VGFEAPPRLPDDDLEDVRADDAAVALPAAPGAVHQDVGVAAGGVGLGHGLAVEDGHPDFVLVVGDVEL